MNVFLRSSAAPAGVPSTIPGPYSLVIRGGTATASNPNLTPLFATAHGTLQASSLVMETDGTLFFQGGTADLGSTNALAAASAQLLIANDKTIHTKGSAVLIGGTAKVAATDPYRHIPLTSITAPNSQAMARMDPSNFTLTVDGILVLQGGKSIGPAGSLASARIDAGDQIRIKVNGVLDYTYSPSGGGSATLTGSSFYMIGGPDSGFFDAQNVDLAGSLPYPQAFPVTVTLAGSFQKVADSGLGASIVQTGVVVFDDNLLSYVIFAANEETRVLGIRRGLTDNDDITPACK